MKQSLVKLDGSKGEGGGQILRSSLTLSMLTGRPFLIEKIRAKRPKPGLRPQHLQAVRAAAKICDAKVSGAAESSSTLKFEPQSISAGDYRFTISTAGSSALVLHTVYLPLALTNKSSTIEITGGTHVIAAPCFDYLHYAWLPAVERMGLICSIGLECCGFYPRGGGSISATIAPSELKPITWRSRGKLVELKIVSMTSRLPQSIADRQLDQANARINAELNQHTRHLILNREGGGPGTMLGIHAVFEHGATFFFGLGAKGKPAERVADEAVDQLLAFLETDDGCAADPHLADQLLLPSVLADGESSYTVAAVTQHLLTNADVITRFVDRKITVEGELDCPGLVSVKS